MDTKLFSTNDYWRFNFVDAECGRGKTYSAIQHIKQWQHEFNFLYVAPTIKLLEQVYKSMSDELGANKDYIKIIHSDNSKNVSGEFYEYVRGLDNSDDSDDSDDSGHIILITWETFINLQHNYQIKNFIIFIDEVPSVDTPYFMNIRYNFHYICDYLEISDTVNETIGKVKAKDKEALRSLVDKKAKIDDVFNLFAPLFRDVLSTKRDVFVDLKSWDNVVNRRSRGKKTEKIYFLSMINPKAFISIIGDTKVILLGANIENSMLVDWFERYHGIQGKSFPLRLLDRFDLANRIMVSYFWKDVNWSKYRRDTKPSEHSITYGQKMYECFADELGDDKFLLVDNKDNKTVLDQLKGAKRINVVAKGMNEYKAYTNIVHIPALNREPKHWKMLEDLGFDLETVKRSSSYETLYQNVMRTALRDKDSTEVVHVFVPTEYEAKWLVEIFGAGVSLRYLGGDNPEYVKYAPLSNAQKAKNKRANTLTNSIFDKKPGQKFSNNSLYALTFSKKINVKNTPENYYVHDFPDLKEFVKVMEGLSKKTIAKKDESILFNPITYKTDDNGKVRLKKNFEQAGMLVLDFDDGCVSKDDFIKIFWKKSPAIQKRSFIICNSFSRSAEKPNKFRVIMPYFQPATSLAEHEAVYKSIVSRLEGEFPGQNLGIDKTCINGTQSFYVPSTNRSYPDYAFFEKYGCSPKDAKHLIDPTIYSKTTKREQTKTRTPVVPISGSKKQVDIEQIIVEATGTYRMIPVGQGQRNTGLFVCASKICAAGVDRLQLESILYGLAGTEDKIRGRIKGILKSLY